ncbi:hypothetical protein L2E82_25659 [Cichorium intybus]|uniref:Uncharacterized protein n=1 Tax=Cichorium intybus TaxID=13427 RepID=A0ACB9E499_CICIN|nr:hypothetical protein L2E82_25659 [Cichorium intybus]
MRRVFLPLDYFPLLRYHFYPFLPPHIRSHSNPSRISVTVGAPSAPTGPWSANGAVADRKNLPRAHHLCFSVSNFNSFVKTLKKEMGLKDSTVVSKCFLGLSSFVLQSVNCWGLRGNHIGISIFFDFMLTAIDQKLEYSL